MPELPIHLLRTLSPSLDPVGGLGTRTPEGQDEVAPSGGDERAGFFRLGENLRRTIEKDLLKVLGWRKIIFLTGPRGVGKTRLMFRLIDHLINRRHFTRQQILYFDLEKAEVERELEALVSTQPAEPEKLQKELLSWLEKKGVNTHEASFIFIDETHKLPRVVDWLQRGPKQGFPFFIISDSFLLDRERSKKLPKFAQLEEIRPLSFREFLRFEGMPFREIDMLPESLSKKYFLADFKPYPKKGLPDFASKFDVFRSYGGFPKVVTTYGHQEKIDQLREVWRALLQDIIEEGEVRDTRGLQRLLESLANQVGQYLSLSNLISSTGLARATVIRYLSILEKSSLITRLKPYFTEPTKELVKPFQVFFNDTGLLNSLSNYFFTPELRMSLSTYQANLLKNAVVVELIKRGEEIYYWHKKHGAGVDLVLKREMLLPIVVRGYFKHLKIPAGLKSFIRQYHPPFALVINYQFYTEVKFNNTRIFFLPPWAI